MVQAISQRHLDQEIFQEFREFRSEFFRISNKKNRWLQNSLGISTRKIEKFRNKYHQYPLFQVFQFFKKVDIRIRIEFLRNS